MQPEVNCAFGRAEGAARGLYPPLKRWAKGKLDLASLGRIKSGSLRLEAKFSAAEAGCSGSLIVGLKAHASTELPNSVHGKLRRRKSLAVSSTWVRDFGSESRRAMEIAPTMVE